MFNLRGILTLDNNEFRERLKQSEGQASRFAGRMADVTERSTTGFRRLAGSVTGMIAPIGLVIGAVVGLGKAVEYVTDAGEMQQRRMRNTFSAMRGDIAAARKEAEKLRRELSGEARDEVGDGFGAQRDAVFEAQQQRIEALQSNLSDSQKRTLGLVDEPRSWLTQYLPTAKDIVNEGLLGRDSSAIQTYSEQVSQVFAETEAMIAAIDQEEARAREAVTARLRAENDEKQAQHQAELDRIAEREAAERQAAIEKAKREAERIRIEEERQRRLMSQRRLFLTQNRLDAVGGDDPVLSGKLRLMRDSETADRLGFNEAEKAGILGNTLAGLIRPTEAAPQRVFAEGAFAGVSRGGTARLVAPRLDPGLVEQRKAANKLDEVAAALTEIKERLLSGTLEVNTGGAVSQ